MCQKEKLTMDGYYVPVQTYKEKNNYQMLLSTSISNKLLPVGGGYNIMGYNISLLDVVPKELVSKRLVYNQNNIYYRFEYEHFYIDVTYSFGNSIVSLVPKTDVFDINRDLAQYIYSAINRSTIVEILKEAEKWREGYDYWITPYKCILERETNCS